MRGYLFGLALVLVLSAGLVFAAPDITRRTAEVNPSDGNAIVVVPAQAIEVAPGIFSLGIAKDVDGRTVQGHMFINDKRADAKPPWAGTGKGGGTKCYSFLAKGARWRSAEQYITGTGVDAILTETSLNAWNQEVTFEIFGTRNANGSTDGADETSPDGKNEVEFANLGGGNTIAYTIVWGIFGGPPGGRELVEWDTVFNSAYAFGNADDNSSVMDYQNIATHEFGHSAGMSHPDDSCTEETMYRFAGLGETKKRDLNAGDIAGIKELYE